MKARLPLAAAVVVVAAIAIWFFALRGHKPRSQATRPGEPAAVASGSRGPSARPDNAERGGRPPSEASAVLVDDDPVGKQRLEGLVLTADEHPVAGAIVTLSSNPARTATTQTDGSFAFDHLVGRPYTLVARAAAGIAGPLTARASAATGPVVLRLRPAGAVTVNVVDDRRQPVAQAEVELRGLDRQAATADAAGVARFTPVVPGPYDVMARAKGYAPSFGFRPVPTGAVEITMALTRGASVSGRVVDAGGKPVAGARVNYSGASDWGVRPDDRLDGVTSAADGTWRFEAIGAGSVRFVARDSAHAPGSSALITLDGTTAKDGVEVMMPVGASVAGKVIDANQQPVASARVRIGDAGRNMIGEPPREAVSADDGAFVIAGLPRKAMSAVAMAETGASATVPVDTTAGDVRELVLTVDVTGTIAGVVVDRAGEPLDGVQVTAAPDFRGGNFDPGQMRLRGNISDLTDPDGRFALVGLADGTYMVRATRSGGGRMRMFGGDGEQARTGQRDLRIVLPADGGVKGKVALADGTAPLGFSVSVGIAQEPGGGKDGSFELRDLPPRAYRLTVRGSDFDDKTVDVTIEEGKVADAGTITVVRGRRIGGRVSFQGQPVAGATVYAGGMIFGSGSSNEAQFGGMPGRTPARTTTTDDDGRWTMSGLGQVPIAVVAEHPDRGRSAALRLGRVAGNEQQLELALAGFGALTGTVRDADGPAGMRIVTVQSVTTPNAMYSVVSGPDGVYKLDKLAPDRYKASAMLGMPGGRGGMQLQSKVVEVATAAEAKLDLAIEKGPVTVTVIAALSAAAGADKVRGVAWLLPGTVSAANAEALQLAGAASEGRSGFNPMREGQAVFTGVVVGAYSACVAALPKEVPTDSPMAGQDYFMRHADSLPVVCKPLALTAQPTEVTVELAVTLPPYIPN